MTMVLKVIELNDNELLEVNRKFETASPQDILRWAIQTYSPKVGMSSSFGVESACLLHMATRIDPHIRILFLNTGFLFKETIEFKNQLREKLGLNVEEFTATPEQIAQVREKLNSPTNQSGACCDEVKVDLMKKSLVGLDCWIAGLRRSQSSTRKSIGIVERFQAGWVKVHPLAQWSKERIRAYLKENNLPLHPLSEKGYASVGCEPCTQKPVQGGDDRSGRWAGRDKTECGIHTFMAKQNIETTKSDKRKGDQNE